MLEETINAVQNPAICYAICYGKSGRALHDLQLPHETLRAPPRQSLASTAPEKRRAVLFLAGTMAVRFGLVSDGCNGGAFQAAEALALLALEDSLHEKYRERETDTETQTDTDRHRHRHSHGRRAASAHQPGTQRGRDTDTATDTQTQPQPQPQRQRDRQTRAQRQRCRQISRRVHRRAHTAYTSGIVVQSPEYGFTQPYAVSGTDAGYRGTQPFAVCGVLTWYGATQPYAVWGTDVGYGATQPHAVCGTDVGYGDTRLRSTTPQSSGALLS
eukprot:377597-Rhodomonas_salina.1